MDTKRLRV